MQDDSQNALEQLISEGQNLLNSYQTEIAALKSSETKSSETILSEIAGAIVGSAFESSRIGSTTRRLSKSYLQDERKKKISSLDERYIQQVDSWISKVSSFLSQISVIASTRKPNSQKLLTIFSKIETVVRPDTRLRGGLSILKKFALQGVVKNENRTKLKPVGLVVTPGEQFKAYSRLLEIASSAKEFLIIVDPYPSHQTLIILEKSPRNQSAKLLTNPPSDETKRLEFETLVKKLIKDRPEIEIRYAPKFVLHDRFILTKTEVWHIGHSLKDIGNKLSVISAIDTSEVIKIRNEIESLWNQATPI